MGTYRRLLSYVWPYRRRLLVATLCMLGVSLANALISATVYVTLNGLQNHTRVIIDNIPHAIRLADRLRSQGKFAMIEHRGKIARKMQNADKIGARYVVFMGSDEIASGKYKLRNMDDGVEAMVEEGVVLGL